MLGPSEIAGAGGRPTLELECGVGARSAIDGAEGFVSDGCTSVGSSPTGGAGEGAGNATGGTGADACANGGDGAGSAIGGEEKGGMAGRAADGAGSATE